MNALILLTLITSLSACSRTPDSITYTPEPINRPELILPTVDQLSLKKIDWIIITPENVDAEFTKITQSGNPVVLYALSNDGYEALSLDMAKILKILTEQKAIIVAYENYYTDINTEIDNSETNDTQQ